MEAGGGQCVLNALLPSPWTALPARPDPSLSRPQCHLSGCMMDLFVQMAIIMGLKQTLSNCMEYLGP